MSKFSYIKYPFFGRFYKPNIEVQFDKIITTAKHAPKLIKTQNSGNYLTDLAKIEQENSQLRLHFSFTAHNTQQILMLDRRCLWGVDYEGTIHNLERLEKFKAVSVRIENITKDKYLWFPKITYPFLMPLSVRNIKNDIAYYWFQLLYIDLTWEIYRVETEPNTKQYEWV